MPHPIRVLTIDDEPLIRKTIAGYLQDHGYDVLEAANGREGMEVFDQFRPDAVFVDLRMPEMDGMEVIQAVAARNPDVPVIVVSATGVMHDAVNALRMGAADYIIKPVEDLGVLEQSLIRALERSRLRQENRQYRKRLEQDVDQRTRELEQANARLRNTLEETVNSLGKITEKRDPYTSGHQQRVAQLSEAIGHELGLDEPALNGLRIAALLHDIGKIGTPAEILAKPACLDEQEMALVRMHSEVGYEIVRNIPFEQPVAEIIRQHHERNDGSGYPRGLTEGEIFPAARILAVADVVDAMISHRPYRPTLGMEAAMDEIRDGRGGRYDAPVVDALLRILERDPRLLDMFF